MVGFKNGHVRKHLTKNGEPQRYIASNAEEEEVARPPEMSVYLFIFLKEEKKKRRKNEPQSVRLTRDCRAKAALGSVD